MGVLRCIFQSYCFVHVSISFALNPDILRIIGFNSLSGFYSDHISGE